MKKQVIRLQIGDRIRFTKNYACYGTVIRKGTVKKLMPGVGRRARTPMIKVGQY